MDAHTIEREYFQINKLFGQIIGIWPGQNKFTKILSRTIIYITTALSTITQTAYLTRNFSYKILTDQLPYICLVVGVPTKHYNYIVNGAKLKVLLDGIVNDCREKSEEELEILKTYLRKATRLSFMYTVIIASSSFMFMALPVAPHILDIIMPLNESRAHPLMYPAYFFVDEEEYYYPIITWQMMGPMLTALIISGCDMNFLYFVHHTCALLNITGSRFKNALNEKHDKCKKNIYLPNDDSYAKMCQSIRIHKRVFEYLTDLQQCHSTAHFSLLGMLVLLLAVIFTKIRAVEMTVQYLTFCVFTVAILAHVLFLSVMGQNIKNSTEENYQTICQACWYNNSTKTQFLYLLVLHRCQTFPELTVGLVKVNLNTFVQILKASFSYYTAIQSTEAMT